MANYPQERLLRNSRREEVRFGGGHPQGVPQAGAQVPSRRQSRGQGSGGEVQDALRSQRRSQRSQEAQDLRPGRLLLRQHRSGDRGGLCPRGRRQRQAAADFPAASRAARRTAARAFTSISAASISPTWSTARHADAKSGGGAAAAASATSSVRSSAAGTAPPRPKKAPSPAPTSNIRSTFPSGRRSAAA